MDDLARIEAAGWADPTVGAVEWYGILAEGSVSIGGQTIKGVKPVLQRDGSGFYVAAFENGSCCRPPFVRCSEVSAGPALSSTMP